VPDPRGLGLPNWRRPSPRFHVHAHVVVLGGEGDEWVAIVVVLLTSGGQMMRRRVGLVARVERPYKQVPCRPKMVLTRDGT